MSTNFIGQTRLFPSVKSRVQGEKRKIHAVPPAKINRLILKLPAFSLPALYPDGSTLAAHLTCLSQPQFCTELFWGVASYSYWRLGCYTICILLLHQILIDYRLMWLSDGALHSVERNWRKWKVQYMFTCTVCAVIKSGAVQWHPYRGTYCPYTVLTCRPSIISANK